MMKDNIEAVLRDVEKSGHEGRYIADMWRYVLECEEHEGEAGWRYRSNAIPYVPAEALTLCGELGADDVVLDVGCLAGYGLYDLARRLRQAGRKMPRLLGIDKSELSVGTGTRLAELWKDGLDVKFARASADSLPQATGSVSLLVARLLLPYVPVRPALAEIARVLKPGGVALFQIHSSGYYLSQAAGNWRNPARLTYYLRAVVRGMLFRCGIAGMAGEMAMSLETLELLCRDCGLTLEWRDDDRRRPTAAFRKTIDHRP